MPFLATEKDGKNCFSFFSVYEKTMLELYSNNTKKKKFFLYLISSSVSVFFKNYLESYCH